jgi:hypothetical protein
MKGVKKSKSRFTIKGLAALVAPFVGIALLAAVEANILSADVNANHPKTFAHPTYSSPIGLSRDNKLVWSLIPPTTACR